MSWGITADGILNKKLDLFRDSSMVVESGNSQVPGLLICHFLDVGFKTNLSPFLNSIDYLDKEVDRVQGFVHVLCF